MAIKFKNPDFDMLKIDLDGSQGNAFALMGFATEIGRQLGWNAHDCAKVNKEMTSGDYTHLVSTFVNYFDQYVEIETSDKELYYAVCAAKVS